MSRPSSRVSLRSLLLAAAVLVAAPGAAGAQEAPPPPPLAGLPPPLLVDADGEVVEEMPYLEGQLVPAGYVVDERPRVGLVVLGSIGLGLSYTLSLGIGAAFVAGGNDGGAALFVPGLGPFFAIGTLGVTKGGALQNLARFALVLDGLGQSGNLAALIVGVTLREQVLVRSELALSLTPTVPGTDAPGLGLVGEL
ncbi:MAG: hypothetical protein HY908_10955 [Myxococcales bacterium]|nr:hypothetical protein [Myxococcales bacterium]